MHFDAVIVPRGLEARAVAAGWPGARQRMFTVPAGAAAAGALTALAPVDTALVLGVCGALDPALHVGDVVVYARIADGPQSIELDRELASACARACDREPLDAAAVAHVVGDVAGKRALRRATAAAVIDMEAAPLARALHARGARVAMVRIVSDDAERELPDLRDVYDPSGSLRPVALAVALLRTPGRSARFIADVIRASGALRDTAARLAFSADL